MQQSVQATLGAIGGPSNHLNFSDPVANSDLFLSMSRSPTNIIPATSTTTANTTEDTEMVRPRNSARVAAAAAAAAAAQASSVAPPAFRVAPPRRNPPTGSDAVIQTLLRLPGFAWEEDVDW